MKRKYKPYPNEQAYRGGCKVAWNYYASKADAEKASLAARHNASLKECEGFDFGYQFPGSIRKIEAGEYKDLYEVCLP